MAEKKDEGYKPKLYNPLHDEKSIDDVLKGYQNLFTEETQEKVRTEKADDRDQLYSRLVGHLAQVHGVDEKTKKLKKESYHDQKDPKTKKKLAEDLVGVLALHGIGKAYGQAAVAAHADPKNHQLLRDYVEQHMATEGAKTYDQIVDLFANSKNLRADFHEDTPIRQVVNTYLDNINTHTRKALEYKNHLAKFENYESIHKFVENILKPHNLRPKKGAPLEALLGTIPVATNPGLHEQLKHMKHLEKIPEEKKK